MGAALLSDPDKIESVSIISVYHLFYKQHWVFCLSDKMIDSISDCVP